MINKRLYNDLMLKICLIMVLLLYSWAAYDSVTAGAHTSYFSTNYHIIYVNKGDTIWSIAANNVNEKEDIRNLVTGIKQLNGLSSNVTIYPGQSLKVPLRNQI